MNSHALTKLLAWTIALTLVALPFVGVLNGWFAADRWPVDKLDVRAEFNHISAEQIRAAAQPLLGKGFFAIDLDGVRAAVAKLPWVEHAEARKRWPDTIDLVIYERQPYARWGADRLVSRSGELFTVTGTDGLQGLPQLGGPDDRLGDVLQFYADCIKEFSGSGLVIDAVTLSQRGGWKLNLASGAVIEIGRDNAKEHLARFLDVWPSLAGARPEPPEYIDLRYENGFSMRWPAPVAVPAGNQKSGVGNGQKPAAVPSTVPLAQLFDSRTAIPDFRLFDSRFPIPDSRPL